MQKPADDTADYILSRVETHTRVGGDNAEAQNGEDDRGWPK